MPDAAPSSLVHRSGRPRRTKIAAPRAAYSDARALLVIDQERLHAAAWGEYHTAQKQHQKAARDLHRHEEADMPAYEAWLHRTFPLLLTTVRNLQDEVAVKGQKVQLVRTMAAITGRSAKKLWQEYKETENNPEGFGADEDDASEGRRRAGERESDTDEDDDFFFEDDEEPLRGRARRSDFEREQASQPLRSVDAREIYRRLVQRLHPDRGGDWTTARKRLWHEVQQAWATGDADWLARLEVEWETANEMLTRTSPLSRLRLAIAELHAARRDTERKLREYRKTPPWRFTLTEKKRELLLRRTEQSLQRDLEFLRKQLAYFDATISAWEEPALGRARPRHTAPQW